MSRVFILKISDQVENKGQQDECKADPLGHLCKLGVPCLGLCLEAHTLAATADSTGQTCALAGLEQNDHDEEQAADKLNDSDSNFHVVFILSMSNGRTTPILINSHAKYNTTLMQEFQVFFIRFAILFSAFGLREAF